MKPIINPKCLYCNSEYRPKGMFNNRLSDLSGEYSLKTVTIVCDVCGETYYVSKQIRYLGRKKEMSKVEKESLDDNWILGNSGIRPQDKQLCIAINSATDIPMIGIWLENVRIDRYSDPSDYFLDVTAVMEFHIMQRREFPGFLPMDTVDRWKPINFPTDVNSQILEVIQQYFEGDEE